MGIFGRGGEKPPRKPLNASELAEEPGSDLERLIERPLDKDQIAWVWEKQEDVIPALKESDVRRLHGLGLSDQQIIDLNHDLPKAYYLLNGGDAAYRHDRALSGKADQEAPDVSFKDEAVSVESSQEPEPPPLELGPDIAFRDETVEIREPEDLPGTEPPPNPEERTPAEERAEEREALRESVKAAEDLQEEKAVELAKKQGVLGERTAMRTLEDEYLREYAEFHTHKEWGEKVPEELRKLENRYHIARLDYAAALERTVWDRLESRDDFMAASPEEKDAITRRNARVLERYNRLVRFNEIVKPGAERKIRAREEALESRERGIVSRAFGWYVEKNRQLERLVGGKKHAIVVRAAAAAGLVTVGTAGAAAVGGVLTASAMIGLAGWGTLRFGRGVLAALGASAAGESLATLYEKTRGRRKQEEAKGRLAYAGRTSGTLTFGDLLDYDYERERLLKEADEKTLAQRKNRIRMLTAFGLGAGAAAAVVDWGVDSVDAEGVQDESTANTLGGSDQIGERVSGSASLEAEQSSSPAPEAPQPEPAPTPTPDAPPPAPESAPAAPAPEAPTTPEAPAGAEMARWDITPGDGTDNAFAEMQQHLRGTMTPEQISEASPALKFFLESHPNEISRSMGAELYGEMGMLVHEGDSFYIDQNQNVWFDPKDGDPQLFIENKGEGYEIHTIEGRGPISSSAPEAAPAPAETAADESTPVPQPEASTAEPEPTPDIPQSAAVPVDQIISQAPGQPPLPPAPDVSSGAVPVESTFSSGAEAGSSVAAVPVDSVISGVDTPPPSGTIAPGQAVPVEQTFGAAQAAWVSGSPLPPEPSVFSMRGGDNMVYVHANSPEESLRLARDYAREHPGTTIFFDNRKDDWLLGTKPVIGSVQFDRYGNVQSINDVRAEDGSVLKSIDTRLLTNRII